MGTGMHAYAYAWVVGEMGAIAPGRAEESV